MSSPRVIGPLKSVKANPMIPRKENTKLEIPATKRAEATNPIRTLTKGLS